jgi:hypothetical protein
MLPVMAREHLRNELAAVPLAVRRTSAIEIRRALPRPTWRRPIDDGRGDGYPSAGQCSCSAHACRDREVVCGRVELTVTADSRLGLTPRERRVFTVRFLDGLESRLRAELTELVRRRGAVARRAAERMEPIEIVFEDACLGLHRITAWIQPPRRRNGDLHDIEFGLREPAP